MERSFNKISSSLVQSLEDKTRITTNNTSLNLKETELRLGLPGSHSPDRKVCLFGKDLETNDKSNGYGVSVSPLNDCTRAPVVGWPPVRSYRTNTVGSNNDDAGCLYVKVSMDGAPYLRKVDLKTYKDYMELSSALGKLFSCFTTSEYVVTYEDKDGDWMLVGDVPWQMFTNSCKRLRILKGSKAVDSLGIMTTTTTTTKS